MSRRRIDWYELGTARKKTAAIRCVMQRLRKNKKRVTGDAVTARFKNVSRGGVITHCWRYGPRLPKARSSAGSRKWPRPLTRTHWR